LLQNYRLEVLVLANNSVLKPIVTIVTTVWKLKNKKIFLAKKLYTNFFLGPRALILPQCIE